MSRLRGVLVSAVRGHAVARSVRGRTRPAGLAAAVCLSLLTIVLSVAPAWANYEQVGTFALPEVGSRLAVNHATGEVYALSQKTVSRFDSSGGHLLGEWGWNVVATGPDKAGVDRVETVTVKATAGNFILEYDVPGVVSETHELPFDASAALVQSELNAFPAIKQEGGRVKVEGGPGDETGSKPYTITYEGALGDEEQGTITSKGLGLGLSGGSPTSSATAATITEGAPAFEDCVVVSGDVCRSSGVKWGGGIFESLAGIAVDQVTGNVYVSINQASSTAIEEFSGDGRHLIASFGEPGLGALAVNSAGEVYAASGTHVKTFKPSPAGDYEHYVYAAGQDLVMSSPAESLAFDAAGDLYDISGHKFVSKFAVGDMSVPEWSFEYGLGEIEGGVAVDEGTGDSFFMGVKDNKVHELDGEGHEIASFALAPPTGRLKFVYGLAFNSALSFGAGRPAGTLYATIKYQESTSSVEKVLVFARPPVFPPVVDGEFVGLVGSVSASLSAMVDSKGYDTHYRFQFGPEDCAVAVQACGEAPLGGGDLGSVQGDRAASVGLSGLSPDTEYHYRVIVSNAYGTVEGPDRTFRTYPATGQGLPDARAYELVSPVDKNGGEVYPPNPYGGACGENCNPGHEEFHMPMQAAVNGDSAVFEGGAFAASGEAANENEYLGTRTPAGWVTRDLSPAGEEKNIGRAGYFLFSPDLSVGVLSQGAPPLSALAPVGYFDLYTQRTVEPGVFEPLVTTTPPNAPPGNKVGSFVPAVAGASSDLSHVIFSANDALSEEMPFAPRAQAGENLYEWTGGGLRLVNVLPGNTVSVPGASFGGEHEISTDGSHIYWTGPEGHVFVRVDGETTVQVPDIAGASFLTASGDGSRVLLSDGHVYELQGGVFSLLADLTGGHGGMQGILGTSEDLSKVYFVDTEVLTGGEEVENAPGHREQAVQGKDNLYAYSSGAATVLVGVLAGADDANGFSLGLLGSLTGDWAAPSFRTAQVTADGRYLAFMSVASLTGYDSTPAPSAKCLGACDQVFLYDASNARLRCVSCSPAGAAPLGNSNLSLIREGALRRPRNLTDNGRVFFESMDALSVHDTNGRVQDVYEYEPKGAGTCSSEVQNGGCVSLISSGRDTSDSYFVDATPSGSDVFFTTRARLVPEDEDNLVDLYDAREPHVPGEHVGPALTVAPPPCTTADSCRSAPVAQPSVFGAPATQTFTGSGNPQAPVPPPALKPKKTVRKCVKPKRLVHGRCVKTSGKKAALKRIVGKSGRRK